MGRRGTRACIAVLTGVEFTLMHATAMHFAPGRSFAKTSCAAASAVIATGFSFVKGLLVCVVDDLVSTALQSHSPALLNCNNPRLPTLSPTPDTSTLRGPAGQAQGQLGGGGSGVGEPFLSQAR